VVQFEKPFQFTRTVSDGIIGEERRAEANHTGAFIGFPHPSGEEVIVRVASSFISHEQAWLNLKEVEGKGFEQLKQDGRNAWNKVLGKVEVGGRQP